MRRKDKQTGLPLPRAPCINSGVGDVSQQHTVLSRLDGEHHFVVGQHARHGQNAAREGLAQDNDVRLDAIVLARKHLAGAGTAGLHLVDHKQAVVLVADALCLSQVAVILAREEKRREEREESQFQFLSFFFLFFFC